MNEKLIINTNLLRKESVFRTKSCVVEKVIAVSHSEFENLKRYPLQDNDLIAENTDLMYCDCEDIYYCLMIYDEERGDGLLIEAEGSSYAGTLHCKFDNGRTLGVIPYVDQFHKIALKKRSSLEKTTSIAKKRSIKECWTSLREIKNNERE